MSKATANKSTRYIPALTGVRAWAALLVFLHHYYNRWNYPGNAWELLLKGGLIGVSLFFTLSGFLLTRTYLSQLRSGRFSFARYWLRRFIRIYPVFLALLLVRMSYGFEPTWRNLLFHLTLTHAYFPNHIWTGLSTSWSLTVEEAFYLMLPALLFAIVPRKGAPAPLRTIALLAGTGILLWELSGVFPAVAMPEGFLGSLYMSRGFSIFGRFFELAAGVALAMHLPSGPSRAGRASKLLPEAAFLFSIGVTVWVMHGLSQALYVENLNHQDVAPWNWAHAVGACALLWSCVRGSRLSTWLLGNPVAVYLGKISFAFYLLQDDKIADGIGRLWLFLNPGSRQFTGGTIVLFLAFAALVYELVEKPCHRALSRRIPILREPGRVAELPARRPRARAA